MTPASRFAASSKPNVAYLELNFSALLKKQTTLPSLAYAGIPYQVFGASSGALAVTIAWSRSAMTRSGACILPIASSTSRSPSALLLFARSSAFSSLARSLIAARSSAVNPLAGFVSFVAGFRSAIANLLEADEAVARGGRGRVVVLEESRMHGDVHGGQASRGSCAEPRARRAPARDAPACPDS